MRSDCDYCRGTGFLMDPMVGMEVPCLFCEGLVEPCCLPGASCPDHDFDYWVDRRDGW